jgi:hypothetical protein
MQGIAGPDLAQCWDFGLREVAAQLKSEGGVSEATLDEFYGWHAIRIIGRRPSPSRRRSAQGELRSRGLTGA